MTTDSLDSHDIYTTVRTSWATRLTQPTEYGIADALVMHLPDPYGLGLRNIYVPFVGQYDIGWIYVPIAAFAIVSMANAVNPYGDGNAAARTVAAIRWKFADGQRPDDFGEDLA